MVKQADVTLIQYPWAFPMPRRLATNDINYYVPRTDPTGPSMSDAVNEIDTAALHTPGCAAYVFTERSYQPFIKDPFDQFSETRTGGAFTFMTGIGGFLQEFIYGYSGLRFTTAGVALDPVLSAQLPRLVLRGLHWRGRTFTVTIGQRRTVVTLQGGPPLPVLASSRRMVARRGRALVLSTSRPDRTPSSDLARCAAANASSAQPGAPALAAVDGSPATGWQPVSLPATFTVPIGGHARVVHTVTVLWGRQWPSPPKTPNVPPPPGPVITLRPTSYTLQASSDGHTWRTVGTVGTRTGTIDTFHFRALHARWLRLLSAGSSSQTAPMLEELTATG
jgi:hypothetical protein